MRVLAIPDLHCPYQHPQAFDFVRRVAKDFKPDRVVCLGDEIDGYGWSRYRHDPAAMNPQQEMDKAIEALQPWYKEFKKVMVCNSNHVDRARKAAVEAKLPGQWVNKPKEAMGAPSGWEWADGWTYDDVYYFHGDGYSSQHAALANAILLGQSVVMGHLHNYGGVTWVHTIRGRRFGMNTGCLIDMDKLAYDYARPHLRRPALGVGIIEDGNAQFIPL